MLSTPLIRLLLRPLIITLAGSVRPLTYSQITGEISSLRHPAISSMKRVNSSTSLTGTFGSPARRSTSIVCQFSLFCMRLAFSWFFFRTVLPTGPSPALSLLYSGPKLVLIHLCLSTAFGVLWVQLNLFPGVLSASFVCLIVVLFFPSPGFQTFRIPSESPRSRWIKSSVVGFCIIKFWSIFKVDGITSW